MLALNGAFTNWARRAMSLPLLLPPLDHIASGGHNEPSTAVLRNADKFPSRICIVHSLHRETSEDCHSLIIHQPRLQDVWRTQKTLILSGAVVTLERYLHRCNNHSDRWKWLLEIANYQVHKIILATWSEVLGNLFKYEGQKSVYKLKEATLRKRTLQWHVTSF